ncbi:hypothetical protein NQ318_012094 [Aromia moschata]|uniref:Uncharacterized protein n=1 Tax=Aromia moschata TaxID=1265417 RepID=A0AAV8X6X8_9CUCU|nr:hypothetical protein NQ318_012094 [Aromia moschata]
MAVRKKTKGSRKTKIKRKTKKSQHVNYNTTTLKSVIKQIKKNVHRHKPKDVDDAISVALRTIGKIKKKIRPARVIPVPKRGGILPLIPIFAGLSALGALTGGTAGIVKAIGDVRNAKEQLEESQRHNKTMESIAMGRGLYMRPYKTDMTRNMRYFQKPLKI